MTEAETTRRYVGRARRTKEDKRFIAGLGRYVADIRLPEPRCRLFRRQVDGMAAGGEHLVVGGTELRPHGLAAVTDRGHAAISEYTRQER